MLRTIWACEVYRHFSSCVHARAQHVLISNAHSTGNSSTCWYNFGSHVANDKSLAAWTNKFDRLLLLLLVFYFLMFHFELSRMAMNISKPEFECDFWIIWKLNFKYRLISFNFHFSPHHHNFTLFAYFHISYKFSTKKVKYKMHIDMTKLPPNVE